MKSVTYTQCYHYELRSQMIVEINDRVLENSKSLDLILIKITSYLYAYRDSNVVFITKKLSLNSRRRTTYTNTK